MSINALYCTDLQEEMEDMALDEEEEERSVRNDAMAVFKGHTGIVISIQWGGSTLYLNVVVSLPPQSI